MSHLKNDSLNDGKWPCLRGFTLVEVLVAMTVLSVGAVASGYYYRAFSSMRVRERQVVKAVVGATDYVEKAIVHPLKCADTSFVVLVDCDVSLSVSLDLLPGVSKLAWLNVVPVAGRLPRRALPVALRRIVFCE